MYKYSSSPSPSPPRRRGRKRKSNLTHNSSSSSSHDLSSTKIGDGWLTTRKNYAQSRQTYTRAIDPGRDDRDDADALDKECDFPGDLLNADRHDTKSTYTVGAKRQHTRPLPSWSDTGWISRNERSTTAAAAYSSSSTAATATAINNDINNESCLRNLGGVAPSTTNNVLPQPPESPDRKQRARDASSYENDPLQSPQRHSPLRQDEYDGSPDLLQSDSEDDEQSLPPPPTSSTANLSSASTTNRTSTSTTTTTTTTTQEKLTISPLELQFERDVKEDTSSTTSQQLPKDKMKAAVQAKIDNKNLSTYQALTKHGRFKFDTKEADLPKQREWSTVNEVSGSNETYITLYKRFNSQVSSRVGSKQKRWTVEMDAQVLAVGSRSGQVAFGGWRHGQVVERWDCLRKKKNEKKRKAALKLIESRKSNCKGSDDAIEPSSVPLPFHVEEEEKERDDDEDSIVSDDGIIINEEEAKEEANLVAEVDEKLLARVVSSVVATKTCLKIAADITLTGCETAPILQEIAKLRYGDLQMSIKLHSGNDDVHKAAKKALVFPRATSGQPTKEQQKIIDKAKKPYQPLLKKWAELKKKKKRNNTRDIRDEMQDAQLEIYKIMAEKVKSSVLAQNEIAKFLSECSGATITPTDNDICTYGSGNEITLLRMVGHTTTRATNELQEILASTKSEELDDNKLSDTIRSRLESYISCVLESGGRLLRAVIGSAGAVVWVQVTDNRAIQQYIDIRSRNHIVRQQRRELSIKDQIKRLEFNRQHHPHKDMKEITFGDMTYQVLDPLDDANMDEMNRRGDEANPNKLPIYTGESHVGSDGKIRSQHGLSEDDHPFIERTLVSLPSGNGLHSSHVGEPGSGCFFIKQTVILGVVWGGDAAILAEKRRYHHVGSLPGVLSLNRGNHGKDTDAKDPTTGKRIRGWHFVYDVQLINLKDLLRQKKIAFCLFGERSASIKAKFNKDLAPEEQNYLDRDPRYPSRRPSTTKAGTIRTTWMLYRPPSLSAKGPLSDV